MQLRRTLTALLGAVVIGMAESTGLAPGPLVDPEQEVHWLSPGLEHDPGLDLSYSSPATPTLADLHIAAPPRETESVLRRVWLGIKSVFS